MRGVESEVAMGLGHLIRLAEQGMHTVVITVARQQVGRIEIWRGEVWHAEVEDLVGAVALWHMLDDEAGHLDAEPLLVPSQRTVLPGIPSTTQAVRSIDVARRFEELVDFGLDAMLARDLTMAWWALRQAEALVPRTRRVAVNLERLRQLGFTGDEPTTH
jgi:hypothetical protein